VQAILRRILETSAQRGDEWYPSASVLASAWSGLVGDRLAELTRPVEVDWDRERLVVETASESWSRELSRRESELLDRIGAVLPWKFRELEFRVGVVDLPDGAPVAAGDDPPVDGENSLDSSDGPETDPALEDSLDSLSDDAAASARRILEHVQSGDE